MNENKKIVCFFVVDVVVGYFEFEFVALFLNWFLTHRRTNEIHVWSDWRYENYWRDTIALLMRCRLTNRLVKASGKRSTHQTTATVSVNAYAEPGVCCWRQRHNVVRILGKREPKKCIAQANATAMLLLKNSPPRAHNDRTHEYNRKLLTQNSRRLAVGCWLILTYKLDGGFDCVFRTLLRFWFYLSLHIRCFARLSISWLHFDQNYWPINCLRTLIFQL